MAKFIFTKKAVSDLNGIWNYTVEKWSEVQADRYYRELLDSCQEIADNPNSGKNYDGILKSLYGLRVKRHIIFYRILGSDQIEITRILHGRMELKRKFED